VHRSRKNKCRFVLYEVLLFFTDVIKLFGPYGLNFGGIRRALLHRMRHFELNLMKVASFETFFLVDQTVRCHVPKRKRFAIINRLLYRLYDTLQRNMDWFSYWMKSTLFWDVKQRRFVVIYRRFGKKTISSILKDQKIQKVFLGLLYP
jgi:hypothetical protein